MQFYISAIRMNEVRSRDPFYYEFTIGLQYQVFVHMHCIELPGVAIFRLNVFVCFTTLVLALISWNSFHLG
ncbi:hypothetical protein CI610_03375 [invertebrate metagenome]|uniref:Uncharacterized protein n=1 Tax=invertebrate metagenome TaxID=1711999 RepID=A0A2H9T3D6_9ZZZZ